MPSRAVLQSRRAFLRFRFATHDRREKTPPERGGSVSGKREGINSRGKAVARVDRGERLAFLAERTERAMKYDSAILQRQPSLDVPGGVGSHLMRIQWSTVVAGYGASCASLFYAAPR